MMGSHEIIALVGGRYILYNSSRTNSFTKSLKIVDVESILKELQSLEEQQSADVSKLHFFSYHPVNKSTGQFDALFQSVITLKEHIFLSVNESV